MDKFNDLLEKYIADELTREELKIFLALAKEPQNQKVLEDALVRLLNNDSYIDLAGNFDVEYQFAESMKRASTMEETIKSQRVYFISRYWKVAAAVLLVLSSVLYFVMNPDPKTDGLALNQVNDLMPGKEGAVLILSDGTKLVLDSMAGGLVATQNNTHITLKNGQLDYIPIGGLVGEVAYNTMSTPIGRQFKVRLPDGTHVWLNAASSITYPTLFSGPEREVKITGEVYFEVARNKKQPFKVSTHGNTAIEVLGTHFNVSAYENENMLRTTLLEGAVKVIKGNSVVLKPGFQAVIDLADEQDKKIAVNKVDAEKSIAWKSGYFNFEGLSLPEAMKQIERWYNVTIDVDNDIPGIELFGEINRNVPLSELIVALEDIGIQLHKVNERKLVVINKNKK